MDRELIEEFSSLAGLAIALNDLDKFRVFLDFSGHVNRFTLRVKHDQNDPVSTTYFQRLNTDRGAIDELHKANLENIKEAKSWLFKLHKKHTLKA